jgi:hypothetical protein
MDEFAIVKSAPPSVLAHSEALESYSLFCTMYVPEETEVVCSLHTVVVAALADCGMSSTPRKATDTDRTAATARSGGRRRGFMGGSDPFVRSRSRRKCRPVTFDQIRTVSALRPQARGGRRGGAIGLVGAGAEYGGTVKFSPAMIHRRGRRRSSAG